MSLRVIICIANLLLLSSFSTAQENRYIVFFKDKIGSPYQIEQAQQFLSTKAIERRKRNGIKVIQEDLPVNPAYIQQLKNLGVDVFFSSKWFNAVLVQTHPDKLQEINALTFVNSTEFVAPGIRLMKNGRSNFEDEFEDADLGTDTFKQLNNLGIGEMHGKGFKGEGINIALMDGGYSGLSTIPYFAKLRDEGRIKDSFDFIRNTNNPFQYSTHGTYVLSTMAAYQAGDFIGGAYQANYFLYVTEDPTSEYRIEEYNWLIAAERADSAGVDIINTSLGYSDFDDTSMNYTPSDMDGKTTVIAKASATAFSKGMLIITSAGNYGNRPWRIVTSPGDVEEVLAIGAVSDTGLRSTFSSTGPTADGRLKPDLMAMGLGTSVINSSGVKVTVSGTSLASPLVASLAAGLLQAYPQLSNWELREALIRSGNSYHRPDTLSGYGIPHFLRASEWIEKRHQQNTFGIYPNPAGNEVLFIRNTSDENRLVDISIVNSTGQKVAHFPQISISGFERFQINTEGIHSGIYFVRIRSQSGLQTFRWVKM